MRPREGALRTRPAEPAASSVVRFFFPVFFFRSKKGKTRRLEVVSEQKKKKVGPLSFFFSRALSPQRAQNGKKTPLFLSPWSTISTTACVNSGPRSGLAASSRQPFSGAETECAQRAAARAGSLSAPTVGGGPAPRSEVTSAARKARQSPRSSAESGWEWWANSSSSLLEARATRAGLFFFFFFFFEVCFIGWSLGEGESESKQQRRDGKKKQQSNLPCLASSALSFRLLFVARDQKCSRKGLKWRRRRDITLSEWTFQQEK